MKRTITTSDVEQYVDGECSADEAEYIEAALEYNPKLAQHADRLRNLNSLLRSNAQDVKAPRALREAVNAEYDVVATGSGMYPSEVLRLRRRTFLIGASGGLAAGLMTMALIPKFTATGRPEQDAVSVFFSDFETYLLKNKSVDIVESSMPRLLQWYSERLSLPLPEMNATGAGAELVGGRLCWLLERRLASLSYRAPDGELVLYIANAKNIAVPAGTDEPALGESVSSHRSSANASLVWKRGQQLFAMVSTLDANRLVSVARSVFG